MTNIIKQYYYFIFNFYMADATYIYPLYYLLNMHSYVFKI